MSELVTVKPTGAELVDALDALGVHFLIGGTGTDSPQPLPPDVLITALVESKEARLELAIIPLLLHHPHLWRAVEPVATTLSDLAQLILRCYYTATHLFQKKYADELADYFGTQEQLPNLFSQTLALSSSGTPQEQLSALADRQATLSGRPINWLGTYEHAAERTLKRLYHERLWRSQTPKPLP